MWHVALLLVVNLNKSTGESFLNSHISGTHSHCTLSLLLSPVPAPIVFGPWSRVLVLHLQALLLLGVSLLSTNTTRWATRQSSQQTAAPATYSTNYNLFLFTLLRLWAIAASSIVCGKHERRTWQVHLRRTQEAIPMSKKDFPSYKFYSECPPFCRH